MKFTREQGQVARLQQAQFDIPAAWAAHPLPPSSSSLSGTLGAHSTAASLNRSACSQCYLL